MSRELDREVAEKVMGLTIDPLVESEWTYCFWSDGKRLPLYSSDISAAFQVVEKMIEKGLSFECNATPYEALFWIPGRAGENTKWRRCAAKSMPEAICRAALSAVKAKENDNATD